VAGKSPPARKARQVMKQGCLQQSSAALPPQA